MSYIDNPNKNLITTSELAKQLNTSPKVILENAKKCLPNKVFVNGVTTYYTPAEVSLLLYYMKNNKTTMFNSQAKQAFTDGLRSVTTALTPALKIKKAMELMQEGYEEELEILRQKNQQLQEQNQQLQEYQDKNKYIHQERHDRKKLRAEIVKEVRVRAHKNKWGYNATFIRYYKMYDETHNFPYKEDYSNYIDTIEDRGHLRELYKIILNDF